jgi:membrane protein
MRFLWFWTYLTPRTLWRTLQAAGQQRLPGLAAEMAYNSMLALFPAILAILTSVGLVESSKDTLMGIAAQLSQFAPQEVLYLIQGFINEISNTRNQGLFSLSFVVSIWAASGALSAAMVALDHIQQTPARQLRPFWQAKLVSLGLTVGTIGLLVVASTLVFVSDLIVRYAANRSGDFQPWLLTTWVLLRWVLAFGIVAIAFAFVYRFGPSRWHQGTPILPGAILASVLWALLSGLFRLYVAQFGNYNKAYGAVGTVIVLLLWLYLTSLVMLMGNQLNYTVGEAMRHDRRLRPLRGR